VFVGRREECAVLDRALADARNGRSRVLVLRGEPGVGKTALVEYAVESATGFRVARAAGVEAEAELAFATLQQLFGPMGRRLDGLPAPQRAALAVAFGLSSGSTPERFLVGLAALSLLSEVAHEQPILCVVDDAQWLDRASAQTLAFVARRLLAERIALIFATRVQSTELAGLPELAVEGLAEEDARTLLVSTIDGPLDERVRDRVVAETHGNPLALLELPRGLTPAQLAAGFGLPGARALPGRIEQSFQRRIAELPAESRRLLLLASADPLGDPARIWRAAQLLAVDGDAAAPAEEAGLMEIGLHVRFRHPLVRSAVYRSAGAKQRREAHDALARATDPELEPDLRAWHRAEASTGPDEEVAGELERSAGRVQERGGLAAAAAFLERAAELTPEHERQAVRLLSAAAAYLQSGANEHAQRLLEQSAPELSDSVLSAQAMRIEGAIRFADGRGGDTPSLLFNAAMALAEVDPLQARETLLDAFEAAYWAGRLTSGTTIVDIAEAASALPAPDAHASTPSVLLAGYSERLTNGYAAAVKWWRRAARAHLSEVEPHQWQGMLWNATGELFDFENHAATARQRVRLAREHGALVNLPVALACLAWCELLSGRTDAADALVAEARSIAAAIGTPEMPGAEAIMHMAVIGWRGAEETRAVAEAVTQEAFARGQGLAATLAQYQLMVLELGHARYEEARIAALNVYAEDPMYIGSIALADVVEATSRSDDVQSARAALERLSERALASDTPWALGLLARARALLSGDEQAEVHYREAIDRLAGAGVATDLARAHLLYGEWLRRRRRRRDARVQLRLASDMLQAMGAGAFAHRAEVELMATGEHARARLSETRDELTPQEKQIAELAANGDSNAAIAAQLFISPHTVAYHLRKVFIKLSVSSRAQLGGAIRGPLSADA
jgi:DNA-binding CsgD family transcriptional regulator